ncbi:hypothetical protein KM043_011245 [Ampulex compressa]|nr:hypothetical protein KM043_011245 [Ampulex compressa]
MTSLSQRGLLGLTILMTLGLVAFLASKRLTYDPRGKESILLEMISNISNNLDRLDAGFETMSTQTEIAKSRLKRLIELYRENMLLCAILNERRKKLSFEKDPVEGGT